MENTILKIKLRLDSWNGLMEIMRECKINCIKFTQYDYIKDRNMAVLCSIITKELKIDMKLHENEMICFNRGGFNLAMF